MAKNIPFIAMDVHKKASKFSLLKRHKAKVLQ